MIVFSLIIYLNKMYFFFTTTFNLIIQYFVKKHYSKSNTQICNNCDFTETMTNDSSDNNGFNNNKEQLQNKFYKLQSNNSDLLLCDMV
jgi:hypothetical protein